MSEPLRSLAAPMGAHWEMTVTTSGDVTRVGACGELDIETAPQLHAVLCEIEAHASRVEIDLRELTFLDSSGINLLMQHADRSRRGGFTLAVIPPAPGVARALELMGVSDMLPLVDAPAT